MTTIVKSRTNVFISPPIYDELFRRKCQYSLRKHGQYYTFSVMLFNKIKKNYTFLSY